MRTLDLKSCNVFIRNENVFKVCNNLKFLDNLVSTDKLTLQPPGTKQLLLRFSGTLRSQVNL